MLSNERTIQCILAMNQYKAQFKLENLIGHAVISLFSIIALEINGHESPVIVGIPRSVECSTQVAVTKMEWLLVGVGEQSEGGGQNLTLAINPTDTGLDGAKFTCKITTVTGKVFEETITVVVKG